MRAEPPREAPHLTARRRGAAQARGLGSACHPLRLLPALFDVLWFCGASSRACALALAHACERKHEWQVGGRTGGISRDAPCTRARRGSEYTHPA